MSTSIVDNFSNFFLIHILTASQHQNIFPSNAIQRTFLFYVYYFLIGLLVRIKKLA